jgi:chromosome segregation protein
VRLLERRRQAWVARERRQAELEARSASLAQRGESLEGDATRAAEALREAEEELARVSAEDEGVRARAASLAAAAGAAQAELESLRAAAAAAGQALNERRAAREAAAGAIRQHQARLQALVDLGERGEGAAEGARKLLAAARSGEVPGEWSLLVDCLSVPAGLEAAAAAALGPYGDALLCDSREAAGAGLAWARERRLPLLVLPEEPVGAAPEGPPSLADSVGAAGRAAAWARELLGRVVVVDDLDAAPEGRLAVTPAGEWRAAHGARSSGAVGGEGSAGALLARRREVEALRAALPDREAAALAAGAAEEAAEAALAAARTALQERQTDYEQARLEQQAAQRESERRKGDLERARHRLDRQRQTLDRLEQERGQLAAARALLADEQHGLETADAGVEHSAGLTAAQEAAAAAETERRAAEALAADQRVRLAEDEQRLNAAVQAARRAVDSGAFLDRQRDDRLREQRALTAERDQRQLSFGNLAQAVGEAQQAAAAARTAQEALTREKQDLGAALAARRAAGVDLGNRLRELMERCHRAEVELAAVETQLRHTGDQWIDATVSAHVLEAVEQEEADEPFALTVDSLMAGWDAAVAEETLAAHSDPEGEIGRLRRQIRALGAINPDAPEQFAEARERYDFLSSQKADLESAREQLEEAIREIDAASRDTFLTAFHEIAAAFDETFKKLFGGGATELRLTDPGDVLETGIDIIVQPPGKKQQNLLLLSGGERALTAAAMLFALLRVRPSPFCVLDEVDAPLDESNVGRFSSMLRDFAGQTQFIVVTHNRGTMEQADTLYGVTMEDRGVSKVLSCTLADPVVAQVQAEAAAARA